MTRRKRVQPPADKNAHVTTFLSYYASLPHSPHYAVMINGPWGVGKTYLVKQFLQGRRQAGKKPVYVSLYGLKTLDEIDEALFQALYPALGWKITKLGLRVSKTLLKRFGVEPNLKPGEVIDKFSADIYVFDDLERSESPINQVMGYINEFVEHDGGKVVVIGNETEITDPKYRERREKLIGKALTVQSAFEDAFKHFVSLIDFQPARKFFEASSSEIASIYQESGLNNLRILQQTMWDFERLFQAVTSEQRKNRGTMLALLRLFFALSFELKAGRISAADLSGRPNPLMRAAHRAAREGKSETPASPLTEADRRYPEIELSDTILSDDVLAGC